MLTAQRYGSQGQSRPDSPQTGQNSPQTALSGFSAVQAAQSSIDLPLSLLGNKGLRCEAELVFLALVDYRFQRSLELKDADNADDAKLITFQIGVLDGLCQSISHSLVEVGEYNYWLVRHLVDPSAYPSFDAFKAEGE